jgi:hypothetical protein
MSRQTCPDVLARLELYAAGECDAAEAAAIRQHLGQCLRCTTAADETRQLLMLLELRLQEPDRLQRLEARIVAEDAPRGRVLRFPVGLRRAVALAAMLLLTVGLAGWLSPGLRVAGTDAGLVAVLSAEGQMARPAAMVERVHKDMPEVPLTLELRNSSDRTLRVWVAGPQAELTLEVRGPGTVRVPLTKEPEAQPRAVLLAPGETYSLRIAPAMDGHRSWPLTKPGDYTVTAQLTTSASAPGMSSRRITVRSQPLAIHIDGP